MPVDASPVLPPAAPSIRAVAYIRVSQTHEGMISPELQMEAISDHCARRGFQVVETLQDLDRTGRLWRHRQVDHAVAMIERGDADVIVVWRWSRVSRNRLDWAVAVDRVEAAGGRLESATEAFDTSTSSGKLARGILAEMAAFESDRVGDTWRDVHARRVSQGLPAQGKQEFGYRKHNGRYVPDPRTGPILAGLYQRYVDGESMNSLVRWMNVQRLRKVWPKRTGTVWAYNTVARILDSGFAAGYIRHRGQLLPGAHPPLITEPTWQAYQARRAATAHIQHPLVDDFLLTGIVWCGCGGQMAVAYTSARGNAHYRCPDHPAQHAGMVIARRRADDLVRSWLATLVTDMTTQAAVAGDLETFARCQAARAAAAREQIVTALADARDAAWRSLDAARAPVSDPPALAAALLEDWTVLDAAQRRRRLAALATRVVIHNDQVQPFIVVHTTWDTSMRHAGVPRPGSVLLPLNRGSAAPAVRGEIGVDTRQLLLPLEASRLLGVEPQTLRHWHLQGKLPHTLVSADGRSRLYALEDVRAMRPRPRRTGGQTAPRSSRLCKDTDVLARDVRAWARSTGLYAGETGRLPRQVVFAYKLTAGTIPAAASLTESSGSQPCDVQ